MRCYVCDAELIEVELDANNQVLPCPECLDSVHDSLLDFGDEDEEAA